VYTVDDLIHDLKEVQKAGELGLIQEAVRRAVAEKPLAEEPEKAKVLHDELGLFLAHVAVRAGLQSSPHDHRTWAVIGVYHGQEDNTFYHKVHSGETIEPAGGRSLRDRDVLTLGPQGIHSIANPREEMLVALHVYGANIQDRAERLGPGYG
jgi:predicted metal-dependent enzyme (double-stranded beta helix superfamily)